MGILFWTSSVLPAASTSNPPLLQIPFGLLPASPLLQRPIYRFCKSLLDFFRASRCFNVQSAASANPFWTSSCLPATSTSNLPLFLTPFGLPPCFPPLQRPIRRSFSLLLDFFPPPCTSQQKVDTTLYFYTSFNEHNTPYTVLESDNSESMPDVLH